MECPTWCEMFTKLTCVSVSTYLVSQTTWFSVLHLTAWAWLGAAWPPPPPPYWGAARRVSGDRNRICKYLAWEFLWLDWTTNQSSLHICRNSLDWLPTNPLLYSRVTVDSPRYWELGTKKSFVISTHSKLPDIIRIISTKILFPPDIRPDIISQSNVRYLKKQSLMTHSII